MIIKVVQSIISFGILLKGNKAKNYTIKWFTYYHKGKFS